MQEHFDLLGEYLHFLTTQEGDDQEAEIVSLLEIMNNSIWQCELYLNEKLIFLRTQNDRDY